MTGPAVDGRASRPSRRLVARVDALLTRDRLTVYPVVLIVLFAVVWLLTLLRGAVPLPDFLARWTAGRLVGSGDAFRLYDLGAQSDVQASVGATASAWFVSPPPVAVLAVPLGRLHYGTAAIVWAVASIGAIVLSARLLSPVLPLLRRQPAWRVWLVAAASQPMLELVGAGQDTGFLLLAVAVAVRLLGSHDALAGASLAVLLVKPQLALVTPLVLACQRRWHALAGFVVGGAVFVAVGWPAGRAEAWWSWLTTVTGATYRDLVGTEQAWKGATTTDLLTGLVPSSWQVAGVVIGACLSVVVVAVAARQWWRHPGGWPQLMTSGLLTTVLAAPHAMVYDLVLLLPGLVLMLDRADAKAVRALLATGYVLVWLSPTVHALLADASWPLAAVGAPWVVVVLMALWWRSLRPSVADGSGEPMPR